MKVIKAYEDSSGNIHKTKESWAKNELFMLLGCKIQNVDLHNLVNKRKEVMEILRELDAEELQNSVAQLKESAPANRGPSGSCDARPLPPRDPDPEPPLLTSTEMLKHQQDRET